LREAVCEDEKAIIAKSFSMRGAARRCHRSLPAMTVRNDAPYDAIPIQQAAKKRPENHVILGPLHVLTSRDADERYQLQSMQ
jgi:hypothetical protein